MTVRGANRPEPPPDPPPDPATLEFMLDYAKGEPEHQRAVHQSLGTKAVQLFSVATVVIGLAAAGPLEDAGTTEGWLMVSAVIAYVLHAICALNALLPRQLRVSAQADRLWEVYSSQPVEEVRWTLMHDLAKRYAENEAIIGEQRALV